MELFHYCQFSELTTKNTDHKLNKNSISKWKEMSDSKFNFKLRGLK